MCILEKEYLFISNLDRKLMARPTWDEYFLEQAAVVSKRATCIRRRFGAVVVKNNQTISAGYCGAPKGTPNCMDIGKCYRQENNIPSGERYELCESVHAEMNAALFAGQERAQGAKMYVYGEDVASGKIFSGEPCKLCKKVIINAGIEEVIWRTEKGIEKQKVSKWVEEANNRLLKKL